MPGDWHHSAATASGVLTAIVGAMAALLGFVVTIGVLVVQQATGTLSPRYMRLWYRDRLQKAVLATFTGTFSFAFSLLREIESDSVPDTGVSLAGTAVAVSLVLLPVYLNRFTHNLRPVAIAELVERMGEAVLDAGAAEVRGAAAHGAEAVPSNGPVTHVRTVRAGAVPAFALRVLVDIAIRALSPAVNDPTTAVQVINYIEAFLHVVGRTPLPGRYVLADAHGNARLVLPGRDRDAYLQLAVCEIMEYGSSSLQVCRRLRAMLDGLLDTLPPQQHPPIQKQLALLRNSVERAFTDPGRRAIAQQADLQGVGGQSPS
ncbi:DUF2254 family protein [Streptomyces sp. NPDC093089]|uniref:DUF2254 family protein n=1 Tax=Streptomyces sp. NPDC093089 TaxID=3366024 RepID=UPI0037F8FFEA